MRVGLKFADLNKRAAEREQMLEALEAALDERATERATAVANEPNPRIEQAAGR